jgi:hypothetical protein
VCCCCAVLAQMNQTMVNMNTTMSLTAIDKRIMMKQAIALALLMLSNGAPWRWCGDVILAISISPDSRPDFGDAPDQTQPNPISDRAQSNLIRHNREPNFGDAPNFGHDLLRSEDWHYPQKILKMPDSDSLRSVPDHKSFHCWLIFSDTC